MSERNLVIVFAVFPAVTQLDFTGQAREHLMRPGEVELRHGGKYGEDDYQIALAHS